MRSRELHKAQRLVRDASLICCALVLSSASGMGQTAAPAAGASLDAALAATRAQMTALRDEFVKAATAASELPCPAGPPAIVVEDVPSFGNYDPDTNTLRTSAWEQLSAQEKGSFFRVAGPGSTEEEARREFETGAHHWVFVHELGHWWQHCRHVSGDTSHYRFESGANRIAAAYWRERDPGLIEHQRAVFAGILNRLPNQVPEGENAEAYFNAHYPDKFSSVAAYIWFQSRMCLTVFDEKPAPAFADALKQTVP